MLSLLWLIPTLPLVSSLLLIFGQQRMTKPMIAGLGIGSLGFSAVLALLVANTYLQLPEPTPYTQVLWTWMAVDPLQINVALRLDGLSLVMMLVITGVGFLIHLYAGGYMWTDPSLARFFAYMNLFVAAMLVLVLADNLVFLYLGWEGVGLCSYLLIGFWYQDPENDQAARKAFVITRIGDTALAIGLFLLFTQFATLEIQPLLQAAQQQWAVGDPLAVAAALLILGGAVGKSAQLPLHSWLPDAMAGPTPVSALIHAATMVTAGVYLIARTHPLFLLAPPAHTLVAWVGALTLLLAAFSALCQEDIKRVLAYSTISQIGYMFLALGVGAWSGAIFHLVTHAFFKALLFLSAGSVILHLHHEQLIAKMGGLRQKLPMVFWCFVIGCACLAALPLTSGFYSKDPILFAAWERAPIFWFAGVAGALLTALYSFRLLFRVFFGPQVKAPGELEVPRVVHRQMQLALLVLVILSLLGGAVDLPLSNVLPGYDPHGPLLLELVQIGLPLLGVFVAYRLFIRRAPDASSLLSQPGGRELQRFWLDGWAVDRLYDRLIRFPFLWIARVNQADLADLISRATEALGRLLHRTLSATQDGRLRAYAGLMAAGLAILLGVGVLL